jgi:hypothetical protein
MRCEFDVFQQRAVKDVVTLSILKQPPGHIFTLSKTLLLWPQLVSDLFGVDWNIRVYIETPESTELSPDEVTHWRTVLEKLLRHPNIEIWMFQCTAVRTHDDTGDTDMIRGYTGTFASLARFQPMFDPAVDVWISRNVELLTSCQDARNCLRFANTTKDHLVYHMDGYQCHSGGDPGNICQKLDLPRGSKEVMLLAWLGSKTKMTEMQYQEWIDWTIDRGLDETHESGIEEVFLWRFFKSRLLPSNTMAVTVNIQYAEIFGAIMTNVDGSPGLGGTSSTVSAGDRIPAISTVVQTFADRVLVEGLGHATCDFGLVDPIPGQETPENQLVYDRIMTNKANRSRVSDTVPPTHSRVRPEPTPMDITTDPAMFTAFLERIGGCPDLSAHLLRNIKEAIRPRTDLEKHFVVRLRLQMNHEIISAIQDNRRIQSYATLVDRSVDQAETMVLRIRFRREILHVRQLQLLQYVQLVDGITMATDFPGTVFKNRQKTLDGNSKAFNHFLSNPTAPAFCSTLSRKTSTDGVKGNSPLEPMETMEPREEPVQPKQQQTSKIALCFLTQKGVQRMDLWKHYFEDNDHYTVYYHNDKHNTRFQRTSAQGTSETLETRYADNSLVEAEGAIYREARLDRRNRLFVLLSDDSVPLLGAQSFYQTMMDVLSQIQAYETSVATTTREVVCGMFQAQNGDRHTYLAPFTDATRMESTALAKEYKIPSKDTPEHHIVAAMQWKILTRVGTTEFVNMVDDSRFMGLMDTDKHFDVRDPAIKLHKNAEIAPPASAPDEFNFVAWCNYRNSRNSRNWPSRRPPRKIVFIDAEMLMHYTYDDRLKVMGVFRSVGVCKPAHSYMDEHGQRWISVAEEGETISFPPGLRVRYGSRQKYIEKQIGDSGAPIRICPTTFGDDPVKGTYKYAYIQSDDIQEQTCADDHLTTLNVCDPESFYSLFARKVSRATTVQTNSVDGGICRGSPLLQVQWNGPRIKWANRLESIDLLIKLNSGCTPDQESTGGRHRILTIPTVEPSPYHRRYKDTKRNRRMGRANQTYSLGVTPISH